MTDPVVTPRIERLLSLTFAVVTVFTAVNSRLLSTAVATGGLLLIAVGLVRVSRAWLSTGALTLLGGVIVAALTGVGSLRVLGGGAAALLSWDFGERAMNLGEHLGRMGITRRSRGTHAVMTVSVAAIGVGAGYATLVVSPDALPLAALVPLCLAAVLLMISLGD